MLYTERFKKEVVKKALSPGVIQTDICRKLGIGRSTLSEWKKKYKGEVEQEVEEINLAEILQEEEIDIDRMLYESEIQEEVETEFDSIDKIFSRPCKKNDFKIKDKYIILSEYRKLAGNDRGYFLRRYGLHSLEVKKWEDEILQMGKKQIDKDDYIKKLELDNKALLKQVKNLERDKKELEYIIELKKKHPRIFGSDEES